MSRNHTRTPASGREETRDLAAAVVATVREPLLVLDAALTVRQANAAFYRQFQLTEEETLGRPLDALDDGAWQIPELGRLLAGILPEGDSFQDVRIEPTFARLGPRTLLLSARGVAPLSQIVLAIADVTEQRRIREELRQRKERCRLLVHAFSQAVWETDAAGRLREGPADWQAAGSDAGASLEGIWRQAVHPEDRDLVLRAWREALAAKGPLEAEFRLRHPGGEWRWTQVYAVPLQDEKGRIIKWVGMNRDITGHKQAELELRQSREKFRKIFALNPIPTVVSTIEDGRILDVNHAFEEITGYSRAEAVGKTAFALNLWQEQQTRQRLAELLTAGRTLQREEIQIVHRSGEIKTLLASAELLDFDGQACFIASAVDITARKKLQGAYRASERNFRDAFARAPVGMVLMDLEGHFLHVNEAYCRITGYSEAELLAPGFGFQRHTHQDDLGRNLREFGQLVHGDLPAISLEKRCVRKDGNIVWVRASATARRDSAGRPFQVVGLVEDITSQRFAQMALEKSREDLRQAKEAAEEANRAKSDFLANMSHEIRTPMTVFMMVLERLIQLDGNPERHQLLDMASRSAKFLRQLIDDVLDLSRIEARGVELEQEPIELAPCVHEAVAMFELAAKNKDLELTSHLARGLPTLVIGDAHRLRQVLVNLIGNAVKFTPRGQVTVAVHQRGGFLAFTVADTGIGISRDKRDLLFKSFSQVASAHSSEYGGSGLGLAISKGLVELMGGQIRVRSRKGQGSVFSFTLPLKTPHDAVSPGVSGPAEKTAERSGSGRILVAEDEPSIRKMLSLMLGQLGWQVAVAGTGQEALNRWRAEEFALVFMDLQMPDMNGVEATRAIRAQEAGTGKHTCIVGLTAHVRREAQEECLQAGMDRVMTKPVQLDDLCTEIERCLKP